MELLGGLLGGLGLLGVVAAVLMAFVVLLILPWWAIIDCIRAPRSSNVKAFGVIALVLSWGVGSLVYGLLFSASRVLRIFTVVAVVGFGIIFVPSVISLFTGAGIQSKLQAEKKSQEQAEFIAGFQPDTISSDVLEPFHAVHFNYGEYGPETAAVAKLTLAGPEYGTARDIDKDVRHVAYDGENERFFALTRHEFGTITPSSGRFTKIEVDPSLLGGFNWPKGIAFDGRGRQVYVMTSHVATRFYRFDPRTSDWQRLPTEIRDLPLVALTFSTADDSLYGLEYRHGDPALRRIHRFNVAGASLGAVDLQPAIPVPGGNEEFYQLHASDGKLVLLLPGVGFGTRRPEQDEGTPGRNRVFVIDPATGQVLRPEADLRRG